MEKINFCWHHEIQYDNAEDYRVHKDRECTMLLEQKNVCTYVKENKECCGKSFTHISSLILHYRSIHKQYACVGCYNVFNHKKELEQHSHPEGSDLRQSK